MIKILFSIYHWCWAFLGNVLFLFPSKDIFVVGVTGTKGKSTTLELMNALAEYSGKKTALISSVRRKVDNNTKKNTGNTMPGRFAIQRFLRDAARAGCAYAFIEVSSQGVAQHRHRFIEWDMAVFLNLAPEHIESHGSFERYREAKVEFFRTAAKSKKPKKYFVINKEDENRAYFENAVSDEENIRILFSRREFMKKIKEKAGMSARDFLGEWVSAEFNIENASAAYEFAKILGMSIEKTGEVFRNFKGVPGRLEIVSREPFTVVVDYAHTPNSLEALYKTLVKNYLSSSRKMICVLGSASGGRDMWKRSKMGEIAGKYCSEIVLTNEDPYDEDPQKIINEIQSGISADFPHSNIYEILDRKSAIEKAMSLAKEGDVVVMTGKGSESSIHIANKKKLEWNEREIVEKILGKKKIPEDYRDDILNII